MGNSSHQFHHSGHPLVQKGPLRRYRRTPQAGTQSEEEAQTVDAQRADGVADVITEKSVFMLAGFHGFTVAGSVAIRISDPCMESAIALVKKKRNAIMWRGCSGNADTGSPRWIPNRGGSECRRGIRVPKHPLRRADDDQSEVGQDGELKAKGHAGPYLVCAQISACLNAHDPKAPSAHMVMICHNPPSLRGRARAHRRGRGRDIDLPDIPGVTQGGA